MIQFGLGLMDRQRLVWSDIVHNHVHEVPPRLSRSWAATSGRDDLEKTR
jgi:sugar lactone lactonase YvrE